MKKVFVSVAVRGLSEEQTIAKHEEYFEKIRAVIGEFEDISISTHGSSEFHKDGTGKHPVWWLGKGLSEQMVKADIVAICGDISQTRGCKVEKLICELYDIPHIVIK